MISENNIKGAEWRKWDLHFHTQSSYDYKDKSISDQTIIDTLVQNNIEVVAITDHHIIDTVRIRNLQKLGQGKITVLPGIEFRAELGGSESIHFIGIFSEKSNIEDIWIKLQSGCGITASDIVSKGGDKNIHCDLKDTSELIHQLGGFVTVHAGDKTNTIENITNSVSFKMALKTDLVINHIDILELGKKEDQSDYNKKVFPAIKSVLPMIICSDNHKVTSYELKANCWIKAEPTFDGLRQILNEPKGRVYIGENPGVFERVHTNRTKYVRELKITGVDGYDERYGKWFDNITIPMNHELVAIIGNKGSGKSAIADMIALCSDYNNQDDFSFLKKTKFRDGKHANNFNATLTWESDKVTEKNLADTNVIGSIEEVKYLPQGQFERLTNEISNTKEFQNEIEKVVFAHLEESDRYGKLNFKELIDSKQQSVEKEIAYLISELSQINHDIISLEEKENPTFKKELENKKQQKEDELKALVEPPVITDPNVDADKKKANEAQVTKIDQLKIDIESIETQKTSNELLKRSLLLNLQFLKDTKRDIELKGSEIQNYVDSKKEELTNLGIDILDVIKFKTDFTKIDSTISVKENELSLIKTKLGEQESNTTTKSIPVLLQEKKQLLKEEQAKLGSEQSKYQQYLLDKKTWITKQNGIKGTSTIPNTIEFFASSIKYIENELQKDLKDKYEQRINKTKEIFIKKYEVVNIYKAVKEKLDTVIDKNRTLLDKYPININASMVLKSDFVKKFMTFINKQKAGTFKGKIDGEYQLNTIISETDFDNEDSILTFLTEVINALKEDKRETQGGYRFIGEQVSEIKELYSYLFSLKFLDYNYQLKQGDKNLEQLSPGERGALLLIFYLLLDKNDIPLIIDQPEDNLDNYSVAHILVPFIKEAKKKRQIIMVTHNPNLAVVADAEQIIYVDLDKENGHEFAVISGSIENKKVNNCIVKVLEGAMPAFNKRKQKYYDN